MALLLPVSALAVDLTNSVALILPSTGDEYSLHSASTFDSLSVNNSTFVFTMSGGQAVTVASTDRRPFTTDQSSATIECQGDQSKVSYSVGSGGASRDITITPGTGTCSTSQTGGTSPSVSTGGGGFSAPSVGGGGGGGSPPPIPPPPAPVPVPQPVAVMPPLPSQAAPVASIARDLSLGAKGDDVAQLQAFLASDKSIYPEGRVTGYFGSLTQAAVRRFQAKYGISQVGRVGPQTRAKINSMLGGGTVPTPVPAPTPSSQQSSIDALMAQIKALQAQINALKASSPQPIPPGGLVPPPAPPPESIPSWMQLTPIPRAGGASVVDPTTGQ